MDLEVWRIDRRNSNPHPEKAKAWMHIGPGDNAEPVLTILLPGED